MTSDLSTLPVPVARMFARTMPQWDIDKFSQDVHDMLVKLGLKNDWNECREVYDLFPENYTISFWEIRNRKAPGTGLTLPTQERDVEIGENKFILRERVGWEYLELIQTWNFFHDLGEIDKNGSIWIFIFSMLKWRTPVLRVENDINADSNVLGRVIRTKLLTLQASSYGQSHLSISGNIHLSRNWDFLFWYLLHHNKSLKQ